MSAKPEAFRLIQSCPLDIPGQPGRKLTVSMYSSPTRRTGRRVIVEEGEAIVFDSDNCYDCANALDRLNNWVLDEQVCAHCATKGLTSAHGQDAETGLPICEACCEKASDQQTASMSADDLAASVATMAGAYAHEEGPAELAEALEVDSDGFPVYPF